jgi:hypothetical protein
VGEGRGRGGRWEGGPISPQQKNDRTSVVADQRSPISFKRGSETAGLLQRHLFCSMRYLTWLMPWKEKKKQQQQQWPPAEHAALRPMCPLLSGMLVGDGALSGDMAHCSAVRCRLRHRGELVLLENTIELSLVAPAVSTEGPCVHVASTCSVVAVPKYRIRSP